MSKRGYRQQNLQYGLYTITQAAQILGVERVLLNGLIRHYQTIPPPTRSLFGRTRKYYSASDVQEIRELMGRM